MRVLIYGATGYVGGHIVQECEKLKLEYLCGEARLEDHASMKKELEIIEPTHVILAAGIIGRPNVDALEENKEKTVDVNIVSTAVLAMYCRELGIHLTFFSTGCIYHYDFEHPEGGPGVTESDPPNFDKSYYSKTKIICHSILQEYPHVLILRLRMPVTADYSERNIITKLIKYEKVVNIPNSMTVLSDLIPVALDMLSKNITGTFNFTNPGALSHNELLQMYHDIVDHTFKWTNFTVAEQAKVIRVPRSNTCLDTSKLTALYPDVPDIKTSMSRVMNELRKVSKP